MHYLPDRRSNAGSLDRGSSATHQRSCGSEPAHQSMINSTVVSTTAPPALPLDEPETGAYKKATEFTRLHLALAGHESAQTQPQQIHSPLGSKFVITRGKIGDKAWCPFPD